MAIGDGRQKNLQSATAAGVAGSFSANYLRGIREYLVQRKLDVVAFMAEFGLDTDVLEDASKRVPIRAYEAMLTRAAALADDVNVGLHVGECIKPAQYGALGYSIMSCKTAQEAFERHVRYESLVSDRAISTYHLEGDQIRYRIEAIGGIDRLRRALRISGLIEQNGFDGDRFGIDPLDRTLNFFYNP